MDLSGDRDHLGGVRSGSGVARAEVPGARERRVGRLLDDDASRVLEHELRRDRLAELELALRRLSYVGFQGFPYVADREKPLFESAFPVDGERRVGTNPSSR